VGTYFGASGYNHAFVLDGTNSQTLDFPSPAVASTYGYGVSSNRVVGYYQLTNSEIHGFIFDGARTARSMSPVE